MAAAGTGRIHSLQLSWQKRFSNGFSFQVNDTWTLYDKGNTEPAGTAAPDASTTRMGRIRSARIRRSPKSCSRTRARPTHIIVANVTWDLPDVPKTNKAMTGIG